MELLLNKQGRKFQYGISSSELCMVTIATRLKNLSSYMYMCSFTLILIIIFINLTLPFLVL